MKLNANNPVPVELIIKYAESYRSIDYGDGAKLFFIRMPNEDAYEVSFAFKITTLAAEHMIDEIKSK